MSTNYTILASNGQEYGPVHAEDIKQWIADGRVEKKTPVLVEGTRDWVFLESVPELAALFAQAAPPVLSAAKPKSGGGLNVIIPYKNVRALTAYYLGVFSVIPILGMPLGLAAFTLGVLGLRFRRQNPEAGGAVHAWIGILVGGFFGLVYLALIILGLFAIIGRPHHINH
jgi:hypothetical protein